MTLSRGLLDKLNAALVDRRIADGFQLLARADKELEALQPADPHAAAYLLCIAQWVDLGFRSIDYLNGIAARFVDVRRGQMSICDYLYLRMVEGHLAFLAEDAEAISIFNFVLQTETTILEPYPWWWPTFGSAELTAGKENTSPPCTISGKRRGWPAK